MTTQTWLLTRISTLCIFVAMVTGRSSIKDATLSYEPSLAFNPGDNRLLFRVKEGAPCTADCNVLKAGTQENDGSNGLRFEIFLESSDRIYEKDLFFHSPGTYSIVCEIHNSESTATIETTIIVSPSYHPVTATTNSPVSQGDELIVQFDLGEWHHQAAELEGEAYFNPSFEDGLYRIGDPQNFSVNTLANDLTLRHVMTLPGTWYLRFNLHLRALSNAIKTIQLVTQIMVLDEVKSVQVAVSWGRTPNVFNKLLTLENGARGSARVGVPGGEKIHMKGFSDNIVTFWRWTSLNTLLSTRKTMTFTPKNITTVNGNAGNKFSSMNFRLTVVPLLSGKDLIVVTNKRSNRGNTSSFSVIITSHFPKREFTASSYYDVSIGVSTERSGRINNIANRTLEYKAKTCYENNDNLLKSYVEAGLGNSYHRIKSFCVLSFTHQFNNLGAYRISATARNGVTTLTGRNNFCVSDTPDCAALSVEIVKSPEKKEVNIELGEKIYFLGKVDRKSCKSESKQDAKVDLTWIVSRFKENYEAIQSNNPQDFYNDSFSFEKKSQSELLIEESQIQIGRYRVLFQVSETPYCGDQPLLASDEIFMNIKPRQFKAKFYGGKRSLHYVLDGSNVLLQSKLRYGSTTLYKWFCRQAYEEDAFIEYFKTWRENSPGGKGCFGYGFSSKTTMETKALWQATEFKNLPNAFKFRLLVLENDNQVFDDHLLELRDSNSETKRVLDSLKRNSYDKGIPRVAIKCVQNCGPSYEHDQVLHFEAVCEDCETKDEQPFTIVYKWNIQQSVASKGHLTENANWVEKLYARTPDEPAFKLAPEAFARSGEYEVSVEMSAKYKDGSRTIPLGNSYDNIQVPEKYSSPACFVRPAGGTAAFTEFEVGCDKKGKSPPLLYEMLHSDCFSCNEESKDYTVFYKGYNSIAKGNVLPMGERKYGYKLALRIKTLGMEEGFIEDFFVFARVQPPKSSDLGISNVSSLQQSLIDSVLAKDIFKFGQLAIASMSLQEQGLDESLMDEIVSSVMKNIEQLIPESQQTANVLSSVLQQCLDLVSKMNTTTENDVAAIEMAEKALLVLSGYVANAAQQNHNYAEVETIKTKIVGIIAHALKLVKQKIDHPGASTVGKGLKKILNDVVLASSVDKIPERQNSQLSANSLQVSIASLIVGDGTFKAHLQKGLLLDGSKSLNAWSIRSSLMRFSFNPLQKKLRPVEATNVVGLSIAAYVLGKTDLPHSNSSEKPIAKTSETEKFLSKKTVHVLIPFQNDQIQFSRPVTLPEPCTERDKELGSEEPCGRAMTTLILDRNTLTRQKDGFNDIPYKNSYIVVRPSRPCRIPGKPCVKITFLVKAAKSTNTSPVTIQIGRCSQSEISQKLSHCFETFYELSASTLPQISSTELPPEFSSDSWSIPLPQQVVDNISKTKSNAVTVAIEHLQRDFNISDIGLMAYQSVSLGVVAATCAIWNENKNEWSSHLCKLGKLVEGSKIHCECGSNQLSQDDLASAFVSAADMPLFFAASFITIPNEIDFKDEVALFLQMLRSYYVLSFNLACWVLLTFLLIWARKKDKWDSSMRGIIIPYDNDPHHTYMYEVVVTTALNRGSGTTAKVHVVLEGDNGISSEKHEISSKRLITLQRGSKDSFLIVTSTSLGQVERIHLSHDNTGDYPSWRVNRIAVFDIQEPERPPSYFYVNSWLSHDIYPYRCDIVATRTITEKQLCFTTLWKIYAANLLCENDVWFSIFFKSRCSDFTRVQRIACLASACFSLMLVTIFLEDIATKDYLFQVGFATIDLHPIVLALEGCVITLPLGCLHALVFNRLEVINERTYKNLHRMMKKGSQSNQSLLKKNHVEETIQRKEAKLAHLSIISELAADDRSPSVKRRGAKNIVGSNSKSSKLSDLSDEKDFDVLETLRNCREIRDVASKVSSESEKIQDRQTKLTVEAMNALVPNGEEQVTEQKIAIEGALTTRGDKEAEDDAKEQVWYRRFKSKRLMRHGKDKMNLFEEKRNAHSVGSLGSYSDDSDGDVVMPAKYFGSSKPHTPSTTNVSYLKNIVFLPKRYSTFPGCASVLVWIVTCLYLATCSGLTLFYGFFYTKDKFLSWLITFILSVVQSVFVIAPLRISVTAAIMSFLNRKKIDIYQWLVYDGVAARAEVVLRWNEHRKMGKKRKKVRSKSVHFDLEETRSSASQERLRPSENAVTGLQLIKSGKRALAVRQVKRYWADTVVWTSITVFVTALVIWQRDPRQNRISNRTKDQLKDAVATVQLKNDVYDFVEESVIPLLFKSHESSRLDQTRLLGTVRLRQSRFAERGNFSCPTEQAIRRVSCLPTDEEVVSTSYFDDANYITAWGRSDYDGPHTFLTPWRHADVDIEDETHFAPGSILHRSFYPNGGYIADLGYQPKHAFSAVKSLRSSDWIDHYTAALFVEFSLLDIVTGHITAVTYLFEFLASGGINAFSQFHSYRPVYMYAGKDVVIVGLQALHLGVTCYLVYSIVLEVVELKWRMLITIFDVWHVLQIATIIVTFIAYSYYASHLILAAAASHAISKDQSRFVAFSKPAYYNIIYRNLISFSAFLCYVRMLKIMRGSSAVSVMIDTLNAARDGIVSVVSILGVWTLSFAITGTVVFTNTTWKFHKLFTACTALTSFAAGMDVPHPEHGVSSQTLWGIYFILVTAFGLTFYSDLYATVISDALFHVRNETSKETSHHVESLAMHWVYEKVAGFFGIKSKAFSGKRIKLRPPPGSILQGNIGEELTKALTLDPVEVSVKPEKKHKRARRM